mmetsp:Transcript_2497/g.6528  ORF Transcript_2497/g.6528 Transcript_2497/m.6528 type:complete len:327 (-) Transcript_2497:133-1113(-)
MAQLHKIEPSAMIVGPGDADGPAHHHRHGFLALLSASSAPAIREDFVESRARAGAAGGPKVRLRGRARRGGGCGGGGAVSSIVVRSVHRDHVARASQRVDKGEEQRSIQPPLVQSFGGTIRRGHHHDSGVEQHLEQPLDDHGVGNVRDLKFVEAQEARLPRQVQRYGGDGIVPRPSLLEFVYPAVHVEHEFVKVRPPSLAPRRGSSLSAGVVKHVHEVGFSHPHGSVNVETPGWGRLDRRDERPSEGVSGDGRRGMEGSRETFPPRGNVMIDGKAFLREDSKVRRGEGGVEGVEPDGETDLGVVEADRPVVHLTEVFRRYRPARGV